ncbi:transmembrane protein, putative (macronuclear) [Tetrahymena thermophila SB210]|uniref:Transmembrane protein, putative n=1 Tax=Tetrahymena thermophila (strain SB210) TaxID=312017 RepID=W7XIP9_TETTS|nr:transmembrane protein, putative [Tetrahymena thermophila SB210]EWS73514.1 transmembrane protein, putative [Tetrahymena thermophila SB210]|eukprot:XP_012653996.1 transmembrane protein, putative [Tetrahymena thermophila SB210]
MQIQFHQHKSQLQQQEQIENLINFLDPFQDITDYLFIFSYTCYYILNSSYLQQYQKQFNQDSKGDSEELKEFKNGILNYFLDAYQKNISDKFISLAQFSILNPKYLVSSLYFLKNRKDNNQQNSSVAHLKYLEKNQVLMEIQNKLIIQVNVNIYQKQINTQKKKTFNYKKILQLGGKLINCFILTYDASQLCSIQQYLQLVCLQNAFFQSREFNNIKKKQIIKKYNQLIIIFIIQQSLVFMIL